ncbi:hypothetical protein IHQ71_22015 [Rhizobium sp. TH2]|uniref:hypothetical protein n=1 Tax=Rhizobium sp. TH2 TaxID=2775403 RepID=UPI0021581035|nr:hypothetical protein [Rhizobium sp. TH2]UVC07834.1 hypothetical protein IHQ71_22015 [Rhizobium sp. TH2]
MTENGNQTRSNAIAAAIILAAAAVLLYFMPNIVLGIGKFSPVLGFAVGALIILAFFGIFWLRSRYRK